LFSKVKIDLKRGLVPADPEKKITRHHQSVTTTRTKGHLEIKKTSTYGTYLPRLERKKICRSPPAEIFNSKKHAKTHEPPFKTAENRPKITEAPGHYNKTADGTSRIPILVF
jgi:hypothetical protein